VALVLAGDDRGPFLDRARLLALFNEAEERQGIAGEASAPGFPLLLEAVRHLGRA
jgi:hypothetical protein